MELRSYQLEAVQSIFSYFENATGNPLVAMPTGTGKSVVIAEFLRRAYSLFSNQRILVSVHVKELVQQNYDKLIHMWPAAPAGVYSAGLSRKETGRKITFVGIGSVHRKARDFGHIDLLLVDEAHTVNPTEMTMYGKFIATLKETNPRLKVIGFSATPWRQGVGKLTDAGLFTDICFDITSMAAFNRLIAEGYLATLIPKKTREVLDVSGVHMRGGEFIAEELQACVDRDDITAAALTEALNSASDRNHWLVFAAGVEHACNINGMLNDMGVPSVAIHSKLSDAERDKAILDFKAGKYRAAVNNNVLTTGFDFPAIDCIIMLRPTASTILWVQMLGRGTRPSPGKENCLVLDFAGNTRRLGPVNDPVIPKKKGEKGGEAPVKLCGNCQAWCHASVQNCPHCGTEFTFSVKIGKVAGEEALIKGDMPVVEIFDVDHITYSRHEKVDRPPMMKVTYYCGLRKFDEYIGPEHDGYALRKAKQWWRERGVGPAPLTTDSLLASVGNLPAATHIRVWINKKYPEIMAHCLDGSKFGTLEAKRKRPEVNVLPYRKMDELLGEYVQVIPAIGEEDDIPF